MKVSRISIIILAIGIAAIAFSSLGTTRSRQADELMKLEQRLDTASIKLKGLQFDNLYQKEKELSEQTAKQQIVLTGLKDDLRRPVSSINMTERLFELADFCGVNISEITSNGVNSGKIEGVACATLPIAIRVDGDCLSALSFVILLNNEFDTGMVSSVSVTTSDNITPNEDPSVVSDNISEKLSGGLLQLTIFSYQGE